ncbi:MAG: RNA polymerase sigma factor [Burkholderiales bacterium]|jgi:RNA polymerase sigma-70 factor (ECF subfamily)
MILSHAIDAIHRRDGARVLAALIRFAGNFELAEDALQEALTRALVEWQRGIPDRPAAWLTTVGKRWLIDEVRKQRLQLSNAEAVDEVLGSAPADIGTQPEHQFERAQSPEDDVLRLIFTCCHPAIPEQAQLGLALNAVCRLTAAEIARAYLESEETVAQRLVRAKRKITAAGIPFVVPEKSELAGRLDIVMNVIYLVFNEGYTGAQSAELIRVSLCEEALRLGRLLRELLPEEPEVLALLALMQLHHARRHARCSQDRDLITLEQQDRTLWDRPAIDEALQLLDQAVLMRRPGSRQIEAAIAALHCQAPRAELTDWPQICALYGALQRHRPGPVVALNAAVAHAMAFDIDEGLERIEALAASGELPRYHLLHAARADLLRRKKDFLAAQRAYEDALALCNNQTERRFLLKRLKEVGN